MAGVEPWKGAGSPPSPNSSFGALSWPHPESTRHRPLAGLLSNRQITRVTALEPCQPQSQTGRRAATLHESPNK